MNIIDAEYLQSYIALCEKHLQGDLNLDDANQALKALNETSPDCSYNVIKRTIMGGYTIPEPRIGATLRTLLDGDEVPNDWYDSGCVPDYDDYYDWQSSNC